LANQRLKIGHPQPGSNLLFAERGLYTLGGRDVNLIHGTSSSDNDGLVITNYADYDPDDAPLISIDLNNTVPNWGTTGGAQVSYRTGSWWNSSNVPLIDFFPPTIEQSSGLGELFLWKNATKAVRQLNIRFEWQPTAAFCSNSTSLPKFIIVNTSRSLVSTNNAVDRPMLYLGHAIEGDTQFQIPDVLTLCPAQGTTRCFSASDPSPAHTAYNFPDPVSFMNQPQPMYWRATAGSDSAGNPIIPASEVVVVEMRVNVMATTDEPNGFIGYRVYRRNGQFFGRGCAWIWGDADEQPNQAYIMSIQQMGGGYYNIGQPHNANIKTTMGRRLTLGTNLSPSLGRYWVGPPTGFVQ
jgi:hypothetical protein